MFDTNLFDTNLCDTNLCDMNLCDMNLCDMNLCDMNSSTRDVLCTALPVQHVFSQGLRTPPAPEVTRRNQSKCEFI
jgi:hypothetical protein